MVARIEDQDREYLNIVIEYLNIEENDIEKAMIANEQINGVDTKRVIYILYNRLGKHTINIRIDNKKIIEKK